MAKGLEDLKVDRDPILTGTPEAVICAEMRRMLPATKRALVEEAIIAEFGLPMLARDIEQRVCRTLPWKIFKERHANPFLLEEYPRLIPDRALLILHRAKRTQGFVKFTVYEAGYILSQPKDPWLVGWLNARWERISNVEKDDRGIVLAYWD